MELGEHGLALLGVVLLVGLVGPLLLARFHLPLASALLLVGAAVGPHGLGLIEPDPTLTTFAFLGATFHVFLAGLEAHSLELGLRNRDNLVLSAFAGGLPAALGILLPLLFGYELVQACFLGAVLLSSSILLTFAMVEHHGFGEELARRAKALSVTLDLASAFAAFALLKAVEPHHRFPLPILIGLVIVSVAALRMYVPELAEFAFSRLERTASKGQERHVRFTLALMLLVIFGYAALDVPPFLSAFLVGFALAPVGAAPELKEKLHLVGHALFIPVFLFAVGLDTDLGVLVRLEWGNLLVGLLVVGAIVTRLYGAYAGARRVGVDKRGARLLGVLSTPRHSITLTATYAGFQAGLLDATLLTAVTVISVLSTVTAPLALAHPWWREDAQDTPTGPAPGPQALAEE